MDSFNPRIVAFCCDKSAYVAADMAGELGKSLPEGLDIIRVPCAGRIDAFHMLQALENGADGVLIFACHEENCQSLTGILMAKARMGYVCGIMENIGLEKERLELCNLATNNGAKFAETVQKKFDDLKRLGPSPVK
ncbi:MAG: hydrogenase iron-sulfur subunit [Deltaproteobacteria bacterium]|nr:hydrogenase iron-sulfur subunit [Deltaproteobacteria bacterium]